MKDDSKEHYFVFLLNMLIETLSDMRTVFINTHSQLVSRLFTCGHVCVACYCRAVHSSRKGSVVMCVTKFQIRGEQQL